MEQEITKTIEMLRDASPVLWESAMRKAAWWGQLGRVIGWVIIALGLIAGPGIGAFAGQRDSDSPGIGALIGLVIGAFVAAVGFGILLDAMSVAVAPELAAFRDIAGVLE